MYKPEHSRTLAEAGEQQIRLGIQGYGGTGKTWAALTFPKPIVANFDKGLGAFNGNPDIVELPFYEEPFLKKLNPNWGLTDKLTLRDLVYQWLDKNCTKFEPGQTLIWDGGTATQAMFHDWYKKNPVVTAQGKHDDFAPWRLKIDFFSDLMTFFKRMRCNIIYLTHETDKKDKDGGYTGKLRPLLTGQFVDQITSHFTDWVRQLSDPIPDDTKLDEKYLRQWDCTSKEAFKLMMKQWFPSEKRNTMYYWCLESDQYFDGKISSLIEFPKYIPANYTCFRHYMPITMTTTKVEFTIPKETISTTKS